MLRTSTIDTIYDDSTHTYHTIIFITTHIVILSKTLENRGILLKDYVTIMKSSVRSRTAHARACLFESSAFTLNESMVAEAMSRQHEALILRSQAACRRTSLTCGGSDQYQSRVTCCECREVLVLHYHSVPDCFVQHAMEKRHRWQASRIVDLAEGRFPAREPEARADPSRNARSETPPPPRSKPEDPAVVAALRAVTGKRNGSRLCQATAERLF